MPQYPEESRKPFENVNKAFENVLDVVNALNRKEIAKEGGCIPPEMDELESFLSEQIDAWEKKLQSIPSVAAEIAERYKIRP